MQAYQIKGLKNANIQAARYMHLSFQQGSMLVLCANIGASFLLLPGIIGGTFQTKAWFVLLCGGLIGVFGCTLIHLAYRSSNAHNLDELFENAFGSVLGTMLSFLYRTASLFRAGITIGIFASTVKGLILPHHKHTAICLLICTALFFVLRCDATAAARFCSIGMLLFGASLVLMLSCAPAMHSAYVLPLELPNRAGLPKMLPYMLFAASGTDILLYLYPYLQAKPLQSSVLGSLLGCASKLYTLFLACCIFGFYAIKSYSWPLISMFNANNLVGIDRPELIFMILFTIISLTPAHLYASIAIRLEGASSRRAFVSSIFACIVLFVTSFAANSLERIPSLLQTLGIVFLFTGIVFPLVLFILSTLKRRFA